MQLKIKQPSIHQQIKNLGLVVKSFEAADAQTDEEWELGGKFAGLYIQVGDGYYLINRVLSDDRVVSIDGRGHLLTELEKALSY
jgi:hypothetical protein